MIVAGYILTGQRRFTERMHPPMVIAHSLTTEFFGIEERADAWPDFHCFNTWPATAAVLAQLRAVDHLAGQNCLDEFSVWPNPATRRVVICTADELAATKREVMILDPFNLIPDSAPLPSGVALVRPS